MPLSLTAIFLLVRNGPGQDLSAHASCALTLPLACRHLQANQHFVRAHTTPQVLSAGLEVDETVLRTRRNAAAATTPPSPSPPKQQGTSASTTCHAHTVASCTAAPVMECCLQAAAGPAAASGCAQCLLTLCMPLPGEALFCRETRRPSLCILILPLSCRCRAFPRKKLLARGTVTPLAATGCAHMFLSSCRPKPRRRCARGPQWQACRAGGNGAQAHAPGPAAACLQDPGGCPACCREGA